MDNDYLWGMSENQVAHLKEGTTMNKVTFGKDEYNDCLASTGERIAKYESSQLWGRGSGGWYITEVDGQFLGNKFDSLKDAKMHLIRKYNPEQFSHLSFLELEKRIIAAGLLTKAGN
jgi:hypothetical protein